MRMRSARIAASRSLGSSSGSDGLERRFAAGGLSPTCSRPLSSVFK